MSVDFNLHLLVRIRVLDKTIIDVCEVTSKLSQTWSLRYVLVRHGPRLSEHLVLNISRNKLVVLPLRINRGQVSARKAVLLRLLLLGVVHFKFKFIKRIQNFYSTTVG